MFDLVEEHLISDPPPEKQPSIDVSTTAVFSMPERYRPKVDQQVPYKAIAIGAGAVILVTIGLLGYLIFSRSQQGSVVEEEIINSVAQADRTPSSTPVMQLSSSTDELLNPIPLEELPAAAPTSTSFDASFSTSSAGDLVPTSTPEVLPLQTENPFDDSDNDYLTAAEERLLETELQKPDTDEDGFLDGNEVLNLYDPKNPQKSRIDTSSSIHTYTNSVLKYQFLYPSSWIAKSVHTDEKEVLVTSASGEFMTVLVEDNPKKLSARDWALSVARHQSVVDIWQNSAAGVTSDDGLSAYVAFPTQQKMLVVRYDLNAVPQQSYPTLFRMLVRSIAFLK